MVNGMRMAAMAAAVGCSMALMGCANGKLDAAPKSAQVQAFATAVSATTQAYKDAFNNVTEVDNYVDKLVFLEAAINKKGASHVDVIRDDAGRKGGLTQVQQAAALDVLKGLDAYAQSLAAVTGDDTVTVFSKSFADLGTKLKALKDDVKPLYPDAAKITNEDVDAVAAAVGKLGDYLIALKLDRELPPLIKEMRPEIDRIVAHMDQELEKLATRDAMSIGDINLQAANIIDGLRTDKGTSAAEVLTAASSIYDESVLKMDSTAAIVPSVQAAMKKMVAAHAALENAGSVTTEQAIKDFMEVAGAAVAAAQQLKK